MLENEGRGLLVDTPPELRLQLVAAGVRSLDAVFITHPHADHVHGIDDLRVFTAHGGGRLPVYVASEHADELRARFSYFWTPDAEAPPGTTIPGLDLRTFEDRAQIEAAGMRLDVIAYPHGWMRSYGFRTGDLAVIVDGKRVPDDAEPLLEGVRVLVINALWFGNPHPTHFNVEEAVVAAQRLGAGRTFLTHLTHGVEHEALRAWLPEGIEPAYDGLTVEV